VKPLKGGVLMSAEDNKAVVRRLIEEVYNEGNMNVVDELVAPDIFDHAAVPSTSTASMGSSTSWSGYAPSAPTFITTSTTSSQKERRLGCA
jgi:hypothetical protein